MIKFKKIEHDVTKYFPQAYSLLEKDEDVTSAYLFGSYAKKKQGPLSDVDFAVLLKGDYPESNYLDKQLELFAELSRILKTDEVDITILNKASYYLAYQILKEGKLLFSKDLEQRTNFQTKTLDNYLDTSRIRALNLQKMRQRIKEGTYGC